MVRSSSSCKEVKLLNILLNNVMLNTLRAIWFGLVCFVMCTGCGVINHTHMEDGYYTEHYWSCGPTAIYRALSTYIVENNIPIDIPERNDISRHIQDNATILNLRTPLTLLYKDFVQITWPHELKEVVESYGFTIKELKNVKELTAHGTGLILIHKKRTVDYHWICYPDVKNPESYWKDQTRVINVYVIEYKGN